MGYSGLTIGQWVPVVYGVGDLVANWPTNW